MRNLKLAALLGVCVATVVLAQSTHDDKMMALQPLRAKIGGVLIQGERELETAAKGKTEAQVDALLAAGARPMRLGQAVQLSIELARPGEPVRVVTTDPGTKYLPNACLLVTKFGLVTVAATKPECVPGLTTDVMVVMDDALETRAWNRFYFKIVN